MEYELIDFGKDIEFLFMGAMVVWVICFFGIMMMLSDIRKELRGIKEK
jgi:hypothetical protein